VPVVYFGFEMFAAVSRGDLLRLPYVVLFAAKV
jgi:hypothetical protein